MKGRLLGLAVLATATMANAAAQLTVNGGNPVTVAEELTAGGYDTSTNPTDSLFNTYTPDQNISDGTIKLTLDGAKFAANANDTILLCNTDTTDTTIYGQGNVSNSRSEVDILIQNGLTKGTVYHFVKATACGANKPDIQYSLNNLIEGQRVTLTTIGIGNAALKADASVVVATIKRQFTAKVDPTTAKIDLKTFKNFVIGSLVTSNTMKAKFRIISDKTINRKVDFTGGTENTCNWKLNNASKLFTADFTLKGKLQEYSTIAILNPRDSTLIQHNISADDRNNGQVTIADFNLNTTGIVCDSSSANPTYIQLKVDGQTQIQPDTKKLTITLKNGSYSRNLITDADAFIVKLDATTLYIPLVGVAPDKGRETYIKLQMSTPVNTLQTVDVTFQILTDDGSIAATYTKTLKAGTALTVTGSELKDAAIKQGKTISGDSFAVKIIVPTAESNIFAYANIVDNGGNSFKRVPVKVEGGNIVE
jgi:CxxC motif-containing protein